MKNYNFLVAVVMCGFVHTASGEAKIHKLPEAEAAKTISLNPEYAVIGEGVATGEEKIPLVIYLHGGGGVGEDIEKSKRQGRGLFEAIGRAGCKTLLVAPQALKSPRVEGAKGGWVPADLNVLIVHLLKTLPVDAERVYLTGNSMGGYGTYAWAGVNPEHFAAIAPMVGGIGPLGPKDVTKQLELWGKNLATIPMKAYYGAKDKVVPADRGAMIMDAIKKAGGKQAEVIVLEDEGHAAGRVPFGDPKFWKWMFGNRRGE